MKADNSSTKLAGSGPTWIVSSLGRAGACALACALVTSCATMGPATPKLSAAVGVRIAEMERVHTLAVMRYFDGERARVDEFLRTRWEPLFLENFLAESKILNELQDPATGFAPMEDKIGSALEGLLSDPAESPRAVADIVAALGKTDVGRRAALTTTLARYVETSNVPLAVDRIAALFGTGERGRMILEFAEDAHSEMTRQRQEMMAPLDAAESELLAALHEEYLLLGSAQARVTARLEAAARVKESQDALLDEFGLSGSVEKIQGRLEKISRGVDKATQASGRLEELTAAVKARLEEGAEEARNAE